MKTRIILTGTFILCLNLNAQEWDYNESTDSSKVSYTVNYINTKKVDDLLVKKRRIEQTSKKVTIFRVQIYSGSRQGSNEALRKFKNKFPDILVETSYEQPYFKTKVAACRSKLEGHKVLLKVKKVFRDAFIFEEKVSLEKL
tara:strand:+ start:96 stop:521 length:426 start_codon:yes stop_codon:yes gene_type:complete